MKLLLIFCLSLALTSALPSSNMVGGQATDPKNTQWLIKIMVDEIFRCHGTFLNQKFTLSLASCFPDFTSVSVPRRRISLNEAYFDFDTGNWAASCHKHELYTKDKLDYDLAVLGLSGLTSELILGRPLDLPEPNQALTSKTGLVSSTQGYATPTNLAYVAEVDVNPVSSCISAYGSRISSSLICTGNVYRNTCQEDAGAPLYVDGVLFGVRLFGSSVCGDGKPSVFHPVSDPLVLDFIKTKANMTSLTQIHRS